MLCLVRYLFVISTSVIDCLGRFVTEMTYYVLSGTLNLTKLKLKLCRHTHRPMTCNTTQRDPCRPASCEYDQQHITN